MLKRSLLALALALLPALVCAQGTVMPMPVFVGLDTNGNPLSGGKLCSYTAGTTTPASTFTSSSLAVANTNPVILDSAGRAAVWLSPGTAYKFILKSAGSDSTCATGTTQWTADGVGGVPTTSGNVDILGTAGEALTAGQVAYLSDGSGSLTAGSWYKADATLSYASVFPLIAIVPTDIASGTAGTFRLAGQVTNLSGLAPGATYYVSGTPGAVTATAPANRRIVGVAANGTTTLNLFPALPSVATTSTITTTGTQTALAIPASDGALTIFANNATLLTLQGITAGRDGQTLTIYSIGAGQVDLANQNGSATAPLRIINGVTGTISLAAGSGRAVLQYDSATARWRVRQHEQGAWITPAFNAGDFTGNGAMTWTLTSGDRTVMSYRLNGRTLTVTFRLDTTTVGGTPNSQLLIGNGQWGGFTIATAAMLPTISNDNGTGNVAAIAQPAAGGTTIPLHKTTAGAGNWTAATDATAVYGQVTVEVQ